MSSLPPKGTPARIKRDEYAKRYRREHYRTMNVMFSPAEMDLWDAIHNLEGIGCTTFLKKCAREKLEEAGAIRRADPD